jgi:hypothetical protein
VTTSEKLLQDQRNSTISQLPSSSLNFKNFPLSTGNFKISKCTECNTTESYCFGNSLCLSHQVFARNFSASISNIMEEDCEDLTNTENTLSGIQDITKLLASLSTQIMAQNAKLSNEIHQVVQTNDSFKQAVRSELDELHALIWDMKKPASATTPSSSSVKPPTTPVPVPSSSQGLSHQVSFPSQSSSIMDQQSQMMSLFAATVSKLSMALSEKSESKSDWPNFSGDQKKFRAWHLAILAQLSLPPWVELYDFNRNDIVETTSNTALNGRLYSKLLLALDGTALKSIVSRKHLHANGLLLL